MTGKRFSLRSLALILALILVARITVGCMTPATSPAPSNALFGAAAQEPTDNPPTNQNILRSRFAVANLGLFAAAGGPSATKTITLNLFSDVQHTAVLDRVDITPMGSTWVGHVQGMSNSLVTLSVGEGIMSGSIVLPDKSYQIRHVGNGVYAIYDINQASFPPD